MIEMAQAKKPDMDWFPKDRNLVKIELYINASAKITTLGIISSKRERSVNYKPVSFSNIAEADEGPICKL